MKIIKISSTGEYELEIGKIAWQNRKIQSSLLKVSKKYEGGLMPLEEGGYIQTPPTKWGKAQIVDMDLDTILMTILTEQGENKIVDMDTLQEVTDIASHMDRKREEILQREQASSAERAQREEDDREREETQRQREERKSIIQSRFTDDEHFILLGFIGANGNIIAQVPNLEDKLKKFEIEYEEVKGKKPEEGSYETASPSSKWWRQYRIHIPRSVVDAYMLGIMNRMGLNPKATQSNYDINDSRYVLKIFEMGFDLGTPASQDVNAIEAHIRDQYGESAGDSFITGYAY